MRLCRTGLTMTTITYRDGTLAADSAVFNGDTYVGTADKLRAVGNGHWCASVGWLSDGEAFYDWMRAYVTLGTLGTPPKFDQSFRGWLLTPDGTLTQIDDSGTLYTFTAPYYAIGSGATFALGAMSAGADAVGGVHAAIAHDRYTAGEVQIVRFGVGVGALGVGAVALTTTAAIRDMLGE